MDKKITVVGSGFVGAMVGQRTVEKNIADVVLIDIVEGIPQGKALDIAQSASLEGFDGRITGTNDFSEMDGSHIVVVTAGFPRTPGMTREELAHKNGAIIKSVIKKIVTYAPYAIIIIVTNPLDVMTHLAWKLSGFPHSHVMGMGGVLDEARFKYFLSLELQVSIKDVEALVLGSHGESMIPIESFTAVKGVPVTELISKKRFQEIVKRTKQGGAEIVSLLKTGSAWHAPSSSVTAMIESIIRDSKRMLPAAAYLQGEFGIEGMHIGVPVILGSRGIERICEIPVKEDELKDLRTAAESVKKIYENLKIE
ncbi:MAG: malate dehydrogenase [Syntrophales bacterium]|jgi:malate dehydrogenase|nr:malate dehydrogenase [Syntrophales bacterium]MDY0043971.1 malate dehydrogenase [Syntrophales bacterium]